jgi:hypothetical protein
MLKCLSFLRICSLLAWLVAAPRAGGIVGLGVKVASMTSTTAYLSNLEIKSNFHRADFLPDGNLAKPAWSYAERIHFDHNWAGNRLEPQAETYVASLWSAHYLYFAYWCRYSKLNLYPGKDAGRDFWGLWERDVVEVFINPQPQTMNHYYEFEVAPNNLWIDLEINLDRTPFNDPGWNSGFDHATKIDLTRHQWTCEMRIPLRALSDSDVPPPPGEAWRVNFFRADGVGDNDHRRLLAWSPVPGEKPNFHTPNRFGILRFVK